ncbi:MAG: rhomboid family intramembrane serine protease [Candidatus Omnitrophica bacterium]|nr:rhomboid family intramembrane serine protease [Candidatus Omnitrophota bacterium]
MSEFAPVPVYDILIPMGKPVKQDEFKPNNFWLATFLIILANIAVFVYFGEYSKFKGAVDAYVLTPANLFKEHRIYTIITSGFIHKDVKHLFFNCLGIFIFGGIVERRFGFFKTIFIYIGALVLSMAISMFIYLYYLHKGVALIGASGAVMGMISAAMLSEPFLITYETLLPIPVMIKGWMFIYADVLGFLGGEKDGISHLAHMIGFLSIGVIIYFLDKKDRRVFLHGLIINLASFGLFLYFRKYIESTDIFKVFSR